MSAKRGQVERGLLSEWGEWFKMLHGVVREDVCRPERLPWLREERPACGDCTRLSTSLTRWVSLVSAKHLLVRVITASVSANPLPLFCVPSFPSPSGAFTHQWGTSLSVVSGGNLL